MYKLDSSTVYSSSPPIMLRFQRRDSSGTATIVPAKVRATSIQATSRTSCRNRSVRRSTLGTSLSKMVRLSSHGLPFISTGNTAALFNVITYHSVVTDTFQGYESHVPSQNSADYVYQSQQTLQADSNVLDGLTISCNGRNKVCVAKSLCVDGYVHPLKQGFTRPGQVRPRSSSRVVRKRTTFFRFRLIGNIEDIRARAKFP